MKSGFICEIIRYVIIDSNNLVDELNRLQQKIIRRQDFERQIRTHNKQHVFENSFVVIELFFFALQSSLRQSSLRRLSMRRLSMISIVLIFLRILLASRIVVDSEFSRISNLRRLLLIFRMLTSILTTMRTTNVSIVLSVVEFFLLVVV